MDFHLVIRRRGIGDTVAASAIVRDLHAAYPNIRLSLEGREIEEVFKYDHRVSPRATSSVEVPVDFKSVVQRSGTDPTARYLYALHEDFELHTGNAVARGPAVPDLILSEEEHIRPYRDPYCVVASGVKNDIPVKMWGPDNFQAVADATPDWNWKQIGSLDAVHPEDRQRAIRGAENLLGETPLRHLFRLIAHADVVLCHVSLPMLLASAFGVPCVAIVGGRENPSLFAGSGVTPLDTIGRLPCCETKGCLAAAALPGRRPEEFPYGWLCSDPVTPRDGIPVGRCMSLITPETVLSALTRIKISARNASELPDRNVLSAHRHALPVVS